jgi:plasmid stabilization system protein ParE
MALEDVDRLRAWWIARDMAIAERFLEHLLKTEHRIAARPLLFPPSADGQTRVCLMRFGRFAYVVYFVVDGADQIIVRIWHGREERR